MGEGGSAPKNFEILPHFTEDAQGRRIDSIEYDKAHFGAIARRKRVKKIRQATHQHKGMGIGDTLDLVSNSKDYTFTGSRMKLPEEEEETR